VCVKTHLGKIERFRLSELKITLKLQSHEIDSYLEVVKGEIRIPESNLTHQEVKIERL